MPKHPSTETLGEPALKIVGLQIWIHGRQFEDAMDVDDGNWLRVTAHCGAEGASVFAVGSILEVPDFLEWGQQAKLLLEGKANKAVLVTLEHELSARIETADPLGHLTLRVDITPDNLRQNHAFEFEIDQSYLPGLISQCDRIGREYPSRGSRSV